MLFHCLSNLPPHGYIIVLFPNKNQSALGMVANIVHSLISLSFNKIVELWGQRLSCLVHNYIVKQIENVLNTFFWILFTSSYRYVLLSFGLCIVPCIDIHIKCGVNKEVSRCLIHYKPLKQALVSLLWRGGWAAKEQGFPCPRSCYLHMQNQESL